VRLTDGEVGHVEAKYWLTLTQTNSPTWEVCVLNETLGLFWHVAQRPYTLAALALGWPSSWPIGTKPTTSSFAVCRGFSPLSLLDGPIRILPMVGRSLIGQGRARAGGSLNEGGRGGARGVKG